MPSVYLVRKDPAGERCLGRSSSSFPATPGGSNLLTGQVAAAPPDPLMVEAGRMMVHAEYNRLSTGNGKAAVVQLIRAFSEEGYPLDLISWLAPTSQPGAASATPSRSRSSSERCNLARSIAFRLGTATILSRSLETVSLETHRAHLAFILRLSAAPRGWSSLLRGQSERQRCVRPTYSPTSARTPSAPPRSNCTPRGRGSSGKKGIRTPSADNPATRPTSPVCGAGRAGTYLSRAC